MRTKFPRGEIATQTIGNIGLYYTCYRLSLYGWNVMPTARNAKGIDVLAYSQSGRKRMLIQVKTLSKKNPVPLGGKLNSFFADFIVVYVRASPHEPDCFILTPREIRRLAHKGEKDGNISYWLQPKSYYSETFKEKWDRIGTGTD